MTLLKASGTRPIRFAVNYSPALETLLAEGRIDVDLIKCPDWPELVIRARAHRPVYVHFPLFVGRLEDEGIDLDAVDELFLSTDTPHVNVHLDPQIGSATAGDIHWHDVLERTCRDVSRLERRFGASRVVIENVPFWEDRDLHIRLVSEPSFIRQVVEDAGAGLLLDLAHARIAAQSLGMNVKDYVSQLPVHRLRELHVTGIGEHEGWLRDHLPMREDGWQLFDWAMDNIRQGLWARPRIIAFEYGGVGERFAWRTDPLVLASQVPRLYETVRRLESEVALHNAA